MFAESKKHIIIVTACEWGQLYAMVEDANNYAPCYSCINMGINYRLLYGQCAYCLFYIQDYLLAWLIKFNQLNTSEEIFEMLKSVQFDKQYYL